jgi:hypothetical protein
MPKLTKKEGLFLSRLQNQGGRLAIFGSKYDRLVKEKGDPVMKAWSVIALLFAAAMPPPTARMLP